MKDPELKIVRASAGSGKTHLLTGYYIHLLFDTNLADALGNDTAPANINEILAVTFTNKATAEMKERIIQELHALWKHPQDSDYIEDLLAIDAQYTPQKIAAMAKERLGFILNEYGDFNISTIDSFFQKIVRAFARELDLQGNYDVELDSNYILEMAVNRFLTQIDPVNDKEIFDWLLTFSQDRIDKGEGWDIQKELLNMAREIEKENYKTHREQISEFTADHKAIHDYTEKVKRYVSDNKNTLKQLGRDMCLLLERHGLKTTDFSYGKSSGVAVFAKWEAGEVVQPPKRTLEYADNQEKWFTKTSPYYHKLDSSVTDAIGALLQQAVSFFEENYKVMLSGQAILKNIYQLGILALIDQEVKRCCEDQDIMLLSNSNELLNRLIERDSIPFIYEKVGNKIHHYMIDEFQDTSGMQWSNFKPLIENSLSQGGQDLIVGDVKQSIYRWRGSNWDLLHSKIQGFERPFQNNDTNLNTNYRSDYGIVDFNNDFFVEAAIQVQRLYNEKKEPDEQTNDITDIYHKDMVTQAFSARHSDAQKGWVRAEFFEGKNVEERTEAIMARIPEAVIELQRQGYEARDIGILCRKNNTCAQVAETLLTYKAQHPDCPYGLDIISNEALVLSARPVIQALISMMQYVQKPQSVLLQATAAIQRGLLQGLTPEEALNRHLDHPEDLDEVTHIAAKPLYEIVEELILMLPNPKEDAVFLQAFRDVVLEFIHSESAELSGFLEWWELTGKKRTISTPADQNAISILSIHKSKGLAFTAVILADAGWELDMESKNSDLLWCSPTDERFAQENLVLPIRLSKGLSDTIFRKEYEHERLMCMIDNLNTAYVAFTRAKEAMFILAPMGGASSLSSQLNVFFERHTERYHKLKDGIFDNEMPSREAVGGDAGDDAMASATTPDEAHAEVPSETPSEAPEQPAEHKQRTLPKLSLKQSEVVLGDDARQRGNMIHAALAQIVHLDHVDEDVELMYRAGKLDEKVMGCDEMLDLLHEALGREEVAPWFDDDCKVLNERTLLRHGDEIKRPDRIVIHPDGKVTVVDYKTGVERSGYAKQVKRYMKLLKEMGFKEVQGFLWYIEPHKIVKVG